MTFNIILPLKKEHLPLASEIEQVNSKLRIYTLISPTAKQTAQIEIFDAAAELPYHYHKIQTQLIIVMEGRVKFTTLAGEKVLESSQMIVIPPKVSHMITPISEARFLAVNIPGFIFPEDVYSTPFLNPEIKVQTFVSSLLKEKAIIINNKINSNLVEKLRTISKIPPDYYLRKIENEGYDVYFLGADNIANKWSIAMLDIKNAPRHFHKRGSEHFIVLNGTLKIELDGIPYYLSVGDAVHILPGVKHYLKSAFNSPVRVLCINFPAFEAQDFFIK